jgi:2-methylisocitrate lyase-like PEP mutase family enzyme
MTSDPVFTDSVLGERGESFRRLHDSGIFVMPCAWDPISALLFQRAGFASVATTSGGVNWGRGRPDYVYGVPRDEMLASYGEIAAAVHIPLSGDLENGYGDTPEAVAECITEAIAHGLVGGSIEDHSSTETTGMVPIELAVEKIAAARHAADDSGISFTITGRAESMYGNVDNPLDDAIERANRYVAAGADCIFIPGLKTLDVIASTAAAVDAPLSIGIGTGGSNYTVAELGDAGVRRISTGGAVPRAIYSAIDRIGNQLLDGSFGFMDGIMADTEVEELFGS